MEHDPDAVGRAAIGERLLLRFGAELAATRLVSDPGLADAIGAAVSSATEDLRVLGLWIPAYGVVIAAAASATVHTPRRVWDRLRAWADRRRASTGGTVGLAQFAQKDAGNGNALLVNGLVMVGAILTNKSAVTLEQVTPIARLTGEYEVIVVPADSDIQTLADLVAKVKADPGTDQHVFDWSVPVRLGGERVEIVGTLDYFPPQGGGAGWWVYAVSGLAGAAILVAAAISLRSGRIARRKA